MLRTFVPVSTLCLAGILTSCATPAQMHDEAQLNTVARDCGLALGELMQDDSQKKLLFLVRQDPSANQRSCVSTWARKNGLRTVFLHMNYPEG